MNIVLIQKYNGQLNFKKLLALDRYFVLGHLDVKLLFL